MKRYAVMYEPGDVIALAGTEFVVLDVEHRRTLPDSLFILSKEAVRTSKFDDSLMGIPNNYAESDLRTAVEGWLEGMKRNGLDLDRIIPYEIDLTTLDGCMSYGKLNVKAAPLTLDEARKYSHCIPETDSCYWLATGWSGYAKCHRDDAMYVTNSGWCGAYCTHSYGVRPALKIPADLLNDSANKPDLSEVPTDTLLEELRRRIPEKEES